MSLLALFLLQLVVVLAAARAAGWAARRVGQPRAVGEMVAGIALGPSLLGALSPGALATLFPAPSLGALSALSQLGVLLFMLVVGLRLDLGALRERPAVAVATSHASIAVPFALGAALAPLLHARFAAPGTPLLAFALFLGAAMSVTAFPVLARILDERGLLGTRLGAIAIAAAAVDDVTAWVILAGVVAVARATSAAGVAVTLGAAVAFTAAMLLVVRPLARRLAAGRRATAETTALVVLAALGAALATERIGIHALFGAFLTGAVMPRDGGLARGVADRLEDVVASVLLPLFFALTGLRTSIGLLGGPALWGWTALVILVAVAGKLGGSAVAARLAGLPRRESLAIGVLMNTRGLMELVILAVGLEIGVISPTLYTMMVVMAIATTAMTSPALAAALRGTAHAGSPADEPARAGA